jgi:hypothetical protein
MKAPYPPSRQGEMLPIGEFSGAEPTDVFPCLLPTNRNNNDDTFVAQGSYYVMHLEFLPDYVTRIEKDLPSDVDVICAFHAESYEDIVASMQGCHPCPEQFATRLMEQQQYVVVFKIQDTSYFYFFKDIRDIDDTVDGLRAMVDKLIAEMQEERKASQEERKASQELSRKAEEERKRYRQLLREVKILTAPRKEIYAIIISYELLCRFFQQIAKCAQMDLCLVTYQSGVYQVRFAGDKSNTDVELKEHPKLQQTLADLEKKFDISAQVLELIPEFARSRTDLAHTIPIEYFSDEALVDLFADVFQATGTQFFKYAPQLMDAVKSLAGRSSAVSLLAQKFQ